MMVLTINGVASPVMDKAPLKGAEFPDKVQLATVGGQ
jgi:hypothetical protein